MEAIESFFLLTVRASWHASILVVVVMGLQWAFRRQLTPNWRYLLWFAFLIRLACPSMPSSALSVYNFSPSQTGSKQATSGSLPTSIHFSKPMPLAQDSTIIDSPQEAYLPPTTTEKKTNRYLDAPLPSTLPPAPHTTQRLALLWIAITTVLLLGLITRATLFKQRLVSGSTPVPVDLENRFRAVKKTLGLEHRPVTLLLSDHVKSPCLFGLFRPRLIIPNALAESLNAVELECVLLHELVHYQRHDLWFSWIMSLLQSLHWFNPIVWFAMSRIRADREMATDAGVLRQASEQQQACYGDLIIKLLDRLRRPSSMAPGSVTMAESKRQLQGRIRAIARFSRKHRTPLFGILVATGTLISFLLDASPAESKLQSASDALTTDIVVNVFDDQRESPLGGALVKVAPLKWDIEAADWSVANRLVVRKETDSEGKAVFHDIPTGADRYRIMASHGNYSTTSIQLNTAEHPLPDVADIFLRETSQVSGIVTDPKGNPIEGVTVSISYSLMGMRVYFESGGEDLITNEDGRWSSGGVSEDINEIFVSFQHPSYALKPNTLQNKTQYRLKRLKLHELPNRFDRTTLTKGSKLSGRVLNPEGLAITNAVVLVENVPKPERLKTDSKGNFVSTQTYVGPIKGSLQAAGYAPKSFYTVVNSNAKTEKLSLEKGSRISLRFVNQKGNPIEGVRVLPTKTEYRQIAGGVFDGQSGAEGLFEWTNAPKGPVSFAFLSQSHYPVRSQTFSPSEEIQTVQLVRRLQVYFDVSDLEGKPIPGFSIIRGLESPSQIVWAKSEKTRGGDGRAVVTEDNWGWGARKLEELNYVYRVEAEGFRSHDTRTVKATEERAYISATLEPSPIIQRLLVDPSGNPLANRKIWLLSPLGNCWVSASALSIQDGQPEEIHTDSNGRFTAPNRPEPYSILGVFEEGYLHQSLSQASTFKLSPWGSVEGTWLEEGKPVEGVRIGFATYQSDGALPPIHFTDTTMTNADGKFFIEKVPATGVRIRQIVDSGRSREVNRALATLGAINSARWLTKVDVPPSKITEITLNHPQLRSIHGRVEIPVELQSKTASKPWHAMLEPDTPPLPIPASLANNPLDYRNWYQNWIQTEEGAAYDQARGKSACLFVDEHGYFSTHSIFPGKYRLSFSYREKRTDPSLRTTLPIIAQASLTIEINQKSPDDIDLGTIVAGKVMDEQQ